MLRRRLRAGYSVLQPGPGAKWPPKRTSTVAVLVRSQDAIFGDAGSQLVRRFTMKARDDGVGLRAATAHTATGAKAGEQRWQDNWSNASARYH